MSEDTLGRVDDGATREWLEADGLGGFASGTVSGIRTRRYHALLLTARTPPTGRFVLVNGFDAWVETPNGSFAITSQAYAPGVIAPDGESRRSGFAPEPWPSWTYTLEDGTRIAHEVVVPRGASAVALSWRLVAGTAKATLTVRPFLSGRDHHALHHENPAFRFDASTSPDGLVRFRPYAELPAIAVRSNGTYAHAPDWYRNFLYAEERARGLDFLEDLASPGTFRFDAVGRRSRSPDGRGRPRGIGRRRLRGSRDRDPARGRTPPAQAFRDSPRPRRRCVPGAPGRRRTIVAGYPWFTDWGRDTFIALRGLCLATGRLAEAGRILTEWAGALSEGMLPNFFPDAGTAPEFHSVDASLWYIVAVHDYLEAMRAAGKPVTRGVVQKLHGAIEAILSGYAAGTRFGIRADSDGLLAAGEPGVPLTWMDAKVGDWVVTPRIGKPVEIQALWINALRIAGSFAARWKDLEGRASESFAARFWNGRDVCLYDVVDVDHRPGTEDSSFRPNQIFAVGGLPHALVEGDRARRIVDAVEARLMTPMGLRTLPRDDPRYRPRYAGTVRERDGAYHQGTVWPFLAGAFVDAWVRVRGGTDEARKEARERFLAPLAAHRDEAGLGHVSEVADGDAPHAPGGCPFQAWSVGEALRIERVILGPREDSGRRRPKTPVRVRA